MPTPATPSKPQNNSPAWEFVGTRDRQTMQSDWNPATSQEIQGVQIKQISNVLLDDGYLTEIFRKDWHLDAQGAEQVFQKVMSSGSVSAWHAHQSATDRLFCSHGRVKVVLYDGRTGSPTQGMLSVYRLAIERPATISVPPGVWHGVQAIAEGPSIQINVVDKAYAYDAPDHWRLPPDTPQIPYTFSRK